MTYPERIPISGTPTRSSTDTAAADAAWTVRTDHHHRAAPQQFGGLELGGHVVAVEVVDEPEVEGALQQAPVDVGLLGADHLDLGEGMRGAEVADHRDEQRHGRRVDRAQPDRPADAVLFARRGPQSVHRVQHPDDVRQQFPARGAHRRAGTLALQQIDPEFAFQIPPVSLNAGWERRSSSAARRNEPSLITAVMYSSCSVRTAAECALISSPFKGFPVTRS